MSITKMMSTDDSRQRLIDAVLDQIKSDVENGDLTAVEELIKFLPNDALINFLPENSNA